MEKTFNIKGIGAEKTMSIDLTKIRDFGTRCGPEPGLIEVSIIFSDDSRQHFVLPFNSFKLLQQAHKRAQNG